MLLTIYWLHKLKQILHTKILEELHLEEKKHNKEVIFRRINGSGIKMKCPRKSIGKKNERKIC